MTNKVAVTEESIIIKKYANRRLYNTNSSSYITLDDLASMTRSGEDFSVLDAKSGNDITHAILTQIIMEEETHGEQMLPVSFLRELTSMYGDEMQAMMPPYLEASMKNFRENRRGLQEAFGANRATEELAKVAEANIMMLQNAANDFVPVASAPALMSSPSARHRAGLASSANGRHAEKAG